MSLTTSETVVAVGTTSGLFLAANPNRIGMVISPPQTVGVTITKQGTAVYRNGLTLQPSGPPVQLFVSTTGNWIQGQLNAIGNAAAETITVLEVIQT
jgi:hypothetical protein